VRCARNRARSGENGHRPGVGGADDVEQVAEAGDEGPDVVFGELAGGLVASVACVAGEDVGVRDPFVCLAVACAA
jgi:hypothetical protein